MRNAHLASGSVIQMGMTSFAVAEMRSDDRDYDNWLATLTQASARLDILQTVVTELCQLCEKRGRGQKQTSPGDTRKARGDHKGR